jgi:hypothetical protein
MGIFSPQASSPECLVWGFDLVHVTISLALVTAPSLPHYHLGPSVIPYGSSISAESLYRLSISHWELVYVHWVCYLFPSSQSASFVTVLKGHSKVLQGRSRGLTRYA